MSAKKRLKLRVGDIFSVPIDDRRVGYGQIAASWGEGHYYFAVFEGVYSVDEQPEFDAVVSAPLLLLALSLDALLFHEHWRLVGHRDVDQAAIPFPAYKEGVSPPGTFDVVDYTGTRRRRATDLEVERLPFRKVVAPIRVEKAFRALNGTEAWDEAYDALRPVDAELIAAALLPADEAN